MINMLVENYNSSIINKVPLAILTRIIEFREIHEIFHSSVQNNFEYIEERENRMISPSSKRGSAPGKQIFISFVLARDI